MRVLSISTWVATALQTLLLGSVHGSSVAVSPPPAPELSFLYTAFVDVKGTVMQSPGPHGIRRTIPIVGGNFTGPRLSGEILAVGGDWGLVDPQTGIFHAETRYNLKTDDGETIMIQTTGPQLPNGQLHLHLMFETGSRKYYWMNDIVGMFAPTLEPTWNTEMHKISTDHGLSLCLAIGILTDVVTTPDRVLRIDVWNVR
ncbi:hypothetical protein BO71DRAFT_397934 [Aspergillus ellipticus CBS 707.79]|uniref:Uncharacterized protein n=1 Tax=Aspergillus ellipticus CBS 707.79 TaxID=1448320 RepID=A0A319DDP2_9EURO|nr:hypothetical protein BO71DRAFT_397934 [Aspergillus ellipticus CBS 707.79]